MGKVKLTLLDSQEIAKHSWYSENGLFTKDGRILVRVSEHDNGQATSLNFYSADGGRTWEKVENVMERFHFKELHDGSVIGFSVLNEILDKIPKHQHKSRMLCRFAGQQIWMRCWQGSMKTILFRWKSRISAWPLAIAAIPAVVW